MCTQRSVQTATAHWYSPSRVLSVAFICWTLEFQKLSLKFILVTDSGCPKEGLTQDTLTDRVYTSPVTHVSSAFSQPCTHGTLRGKWYVHAAFFELIFNHPPSITPINILWSQCFIGYFRKAPPVNVPTTNYWQKQLSSPAVSTQYLVSPSRTVVLNLSATTPGGRGVHIRYLHYDS